MRCLIPDRLYPASAAGPGLRGDLLPQLPGALGCAYPTVCIPPPPPDLDCGDIPYRSFTVLWNVPDPDPHHFDGDKDRIGCES